MKNILKNSVVALNHDRYLLWVIFLAPLINFLSGISIDMCSPSLPAMAEYFQASASWIKNTITVEMLGFALGCLVFGPLMDGLGRRVTIMFGLVAFILASAAAPFCTDISSIMLIRLVQGMTVAAVSIGSRVLIMDHFEGKRFAIAILYTSIAYGLGPVVGPFMGGFLQLYFGWKANFIALSVFGAILLGLFFVLIPESLKTIKSISPLDIFKRYYDILKNKNFIAGTLILGGISTMQVTFPTLGPFAIENVLHKSPVTFGYCALFSGFAYLFGSLVNRTLIHHYAQKTLIFIGFLVMILGVVMQWLFALTGEMTIFTLMLPIFIICGSTGLVFANTMGICLKMFSHSAGTASAVQMSLLVVVGSVGVFIMSQFNVDSLIRFSIVYGVAAIFQLIIYFLWFRYALHNLEQQ